MTGQDSANCSKPRKRHRAAHSKTRAGCSSCKEAHYRCDLVRPTCSRCQKSGASCLYTPASSQRFRGFKFVTFEDQNLPTFENTFRARHDAFKYFNVHSLRILRACRKSSLWDYLTLHFQRQESSLQEICIAIGQQHKLVDQHVPNDRAYAETSDQATTFYSNALRSLRASLETKHDDETAVVGCMLMCLLESLRGHSADLLSHIWCGVSILRESHDSTSEPLREAAKLLRHYAVIATIFNPVSPDARRILVLLASSDNGCAFLSSMHQHSADPTNDLARLALDMLLVMRPHMPDVFTASRTKDLPATTWASIESLMSQQIYDEQKIENQIAAMNAVEAVDSAVLKITKAGSMVIRLFLTSAWSGQQESYDTQVETCRQIIVLVEPALRTLQTIGNVTAGNSMKRASPPAFSIGLSSQVTLMVVAHQCRDELIREQALALLDLCPRCEGPFQATLIKAICQAIKRFEEGKAGKRGLDIPENCRVHHYELLPPSQELGTKILRMFYVPKPGEASEFHDQALDT